MLRAIRPTRWELHFVLRAGLGPYERPGVTFNAPGLQTSADTDPTDDKSNLGNRRCCNREKYDGLPERTGELRLVHWSRYCIVWH